MSTNRLNTADLKLTKRDARKILGVVDKGLTHGLGEPIPGRMCVEAAICYALGLPHGDNPRCVHHAIRSYKIFINDLDWSSEKVRARGMRRAAIAQLGSSDINGKEWKMEVARLLKANRLVSLIEKHVKQGAEWAEWKFSDSFDKIDTLSDLLTALDLFCLRNYKKHPRMVNHLLRIAAEACVEACINFKTQGSKWLDLTEK